MKYNPEIHNRQSGRLKGFDYSGNAAYFITICTKNRENYFESVGARHRLALTVGRPVDIDLSECGKIVEQYLQTIPKIYKNVIFDEFIIMPNHLHAIIIMKKSDIRPGRADVSPLREFLSTNKYRYLLK